MDIFIGVVVGLLVLMLLVTLHEFGHFLVARKNGVNVLEFGIGFPPRAKLGLRMKKLASGENYPEANGKKIKFPK